MAMYLLFLFGCIAFLVNGQNPMNDTCVHGKYPPPPSYKIKEYVINLDLPPEQRWRQVAQEKQHAIAGIIQEFIQFLMEFGSGEIISLIDLLGNNMDDALPSPYRDELKGMANATGIEIGELFIYNIFYEIFSVCTSIVAHDKDGKMFHVRNLDFGLFLGYFSVSCVSYQCYWSFYPDTSQSFVMIFRNPDRHGGQWDIKNKTWALTDALRPSLVNLDWQRGGQTVFKSVNYAGYIGVLTAVKQNKFTFSMNERFAADGGYLGILEWIRDKKGSWMGFLSRETMENAATFEQAKDKLANTQMVSPAYFILGGTKPGEGVVITRNREVNGTDIWPMNDTTAGGWYILETNYDHWKSPFILDDRRGPANKCMQNMTITNVSIPALFDVLSSKPVLNKLTTYSALMQVDTGHLESWLQYCADPCDPW